MSTSNAEWKSNNRRPQSTMALAFSSDLDDAFKMFSNVEDNFEDRSRNLNNKKQTLTTQEQELQALESRLRETEDQLKKRRSVIFGKKVSTGSEQKKP
ncbi:hypothetical protein L228DRAFT_270607 [Xylona heveae TC161]|uniref:Uncharacterized protein n=1 Tax=Xylona heveae (strain CBS 132557 / TC161) TaxID=1328760 RepID=A0A165A1K5_XYLHT|nr:hypothetical protein L228DRAFT_270607 [Xylona heveae TC161]KZF19827.1 hypothetical protein L228DRAFT_270607 [Xylona heveae TC161]